MRREIQKKSRKVSQNAGKRRVKLELKAEPDSEIYVAGSFNGWDPKRKKMKQVDGNGHYTASLMLPPGEHEYKFVANGVWQADPGNTHWRSNSMGSLNSIIRVE